MEIYTILVHLHSLLRWIFLLAMVIAIVASLNGKGGFKIAGVGMLQASLWTMVTAHLQLILGLILYFISPKVVFEASSMSNSVLRFFLVEHILVMIIAIVLVTIAHLKAKRRVEPLRQRRVILIYFIISLILILSRIPWPFMNYGGGWI
jgi:hypothetical protein